MKKIEKTMPMTMPLLKQTATHIFQRRHSRQIFSYLIQAYKLNYAGNLCVYEHTHEIIGLT